MHTLAKLPHSVPSTKAAISAPGLRARGSHSAAVIWDQATTRVRLTLRAPDAINGPMWSCPGRYARALAMAIGAGALLAGCGESGGVKDEELTGLVKAPVKEKKLDLARAGKDAGELVRAVAQPWTPTAAALGDHTVTIAHTIELREGTTVLENLGETTNLQVGKDGSYLAVYENNADYGREVVWTGGQLYLRPRYARWHQRAPETPEEPAAIRDQLLAVLAGDLELVAHGTELTEKGAVTVAGRAGRRIELKKMPSPRAAPRQALVQKRWRQDALVEAVAGEVVLDAQTGVPLRANLETTITFAREGKKLTMRTTLRQDTVAAPVTIAAPAADQVVATPMRSKEVDERNAILQTIAPPVGKAAAGGVGGTPAPPAPAPAPDPAGKSGKEDK